MSIRTLRPGGLLLAFALAWCGWNVSLAAAQEGDVPPAETEAETAAEADPWEIPQGGPAAKLEFIDKLSQMRPQGTTRAEMIASVMKTQEAILAAATQVLDFDDVPDDERARAVEAIFSSLTMLSRLGNAAAAQQIPLMAEKFKDDANPAIAQIARLQLIVAQARELPNADDAQTTRLVDQMTELLKAEPNNETIGLAMQIGQLLDRLERQEQAVAAMTQFADVLAAADSDTAREFAERFRGMARGFDLLGKPLDLEGVTVDGKPLDWNSYRGKVVLVDFWATWCGPCLAELPNVLVNYEAYKDSGFDVLGISLDDDRQKLEEFIAERKIPWTNLFNDAADNNGWNHPMATRYGVMGIPAVYLVDKQGIVVNTNARGPALEEALRELLGPPPGEASEDEPTEEASK